jgi:hypothetical protein
VDIRAVGAGAEVVEAESAAVVLVVAVILAEARLAEVHPAAEPGVPRLVDQPEDLPAEAADLAASILMGPIPLG